MCRYVIIAIVVILVVLMVGAALVVQLYGWQGFAVFVAVLIVVMFVARKVLPSVFMRMLTRPIREMGAVLRGARVVVHSITPCDPPPQPEYDAYSDDTDQELQALEDRPDRGEADEEEDGTDDADEENDDDDGPVDWYQIEFTVTPPSSGPSAGQVIHRRSWSPQLIGAARRGTPPPRSNTFRGWPSMDQFANLLENMPAEVWDGSEFAELEGEVFGEKRLRMRFAVPPDVNAVTLTYAHYTEIGEVRLPRIDANPERES
jgi:hypothetical protein